MNKVLASIEYFIFCCFCLGPALGSVLYQVGGFLLPFMCVGIWCFIGAFGVLFTIPKVDMSIDLNAVDGKKLNILDLLKVSYFYTLLIFILKHWLTHTA